MQHIHSYRPRVFWLCDVHFLQRLLPTTVNIPLNSSVCFGQNMLHMLTPARILIDQRRIQSWISASSTHSFPP